MSSASLFEKQFQLENNRIMNEFELTNYIATTQWFAEGSLDGFNNLANCEDVPKFIEYLHGMESSLDDTISVSVDLPASLNEIANKVDLNKQAMNVPDLVEDNITSINPSYLKQFTLNFGKSLTAFCNAKGPYESGDFERYMSEDTLNALKKQCVIVSGNADESYTNRTAPDVKLNKNTLKGKYIKYASDADKKYKELKEMTKDVCDIFTSVNYMILSYKNTTCKVNEHRLSSSPTPTPTDDKNRISRLQQLVYNGTSIILQAASYISKMLGFKISTFVANMKIINDIRINLQNQAMNESAEYNSFYEEVSKGDFDALETAAIIADAVEGDYSLLDIFLNELIETHAENMFEVVSDIDMDGFVDPRSFINGFVTQYPHKKSGIYNIAESLIANMDKHIEDLVILSNKDLESVDAWVKDHPFKPWGMYGKDLAALDIPSTGSYKKEYAFLVNELMFFNSDIAGVAGRSKEFGEKLLRAYRDAEEIVKLDDMESEIADDIGVIYVNKENKKSLLLYLKQYASDFDQFISDWIYSLIKRFKDINGRLYELETEDARKTKHNQYINTFSNVTSMSDSGYEFTEAMLDREIMRQQDEYDAIFESVVRECKRYMIFKESGINLFFEDGEDAGITDFFKIGEEKNEEGLLSKIGKFFSDLWNTLTDTLLGKDKAGRNKSWLARVKDAILGRDYNGVTIDILPYAEGENSQKIASDINKMADAVNAITVSATELPNIKTEDELFNKITGSVMTDVDWTKVNKADRVDTVQKFFKVGDHKLEKITISGNDVKNHVEGMIKFCENFYDSYFTNIKSAFTSLQQACENKIRELGKASGGSGYNRNSTSFTKINGKRYKVNKSSDGSTSYKAMESANMFDLLMDLSYMVESGDFDMDYFDSMFGDYITEASAMASSNAIKQSNTKTTGTNNINTSDAPTAPDTKPAETNAERAQQKAEEQKAEDKQKKEMTEEEKYKAHAFNVAKWLARFITFFIKPCFSAIEARNNEYLNILNSLKPKTAEDNTDTETTNTEENPPS